MPTNYGQSTETGRWPKDDLRWIPSSRQGLNITNWEGKENPNIHEISPRTFSMAILKNLHIPKAGGKVEEATPTPGGSVRGCNHRGKPGWGLLK